MLNSSYNETLIGISSPAFTEGTSIIKIVPAFLTSKVLYGSWIVTSSALYPSFPSNSAVILYLPAFKSERSTNNPPSSCTTSSSGSNVTLKLTISVPL